MQIKSVQQKYAPKKILVYPQLLVTGCINSNFLAGTLFNNFTENFIIFYKKD